MLFGVLIYLFSTPDSSPQVGSFVRTIADELRSAGFEYSVLMAGDFNEDAFELQSTQPAGSCSLIRPGLVVDKFASLNLDLAAACADGRIGYGNLDIITATWTVFSPIAYALLCSIPPHTHRATYVVPVRIVCGLYADWVLTGACNPMPSRFTLCDCAVTVL